jgi:hypothetical protein
MAVVATALSAQAQFSISPLSTFGNNGWLAPNGTAGSTYEYLTTGNNERSIAYGNGFLYLSAGNATTPMVRILNPTTGADLGFLDMTGVAGGVRVLVSLGVGADGAIYAANLQTALGDSAPYKVYRWANNSAAPALVYSGGGLVGARLGDSMDVIGSGADTRLVAGFGSSTTISGTSGYLVVDPTSQSAQVIGFSGTPPASGDFRLGLTFAGNSTTVIGDQGGTASDTRLTTFSGTTGTFVTSLTLSAVSERQMDYAMINGVPYLATIETGNATTASTVRIYDMVNANSPLLLGSLKLATSANANANATGGVAWGAVVDNGDGTATAQLFAMNSNNGIQAFTVTVPEPGTASLLFIAFGALAFRKKCVRR